MASPLILQVEDNPDDQKLFALALRQAHIATDLAICTDGEEALRFLQTRATAANPARSRMPQLVLLDLKIPKVDGFEVLRRLRAVPATRLLPVVVLSSSCEHRDVAGSYRLGANGYVRKPIEFERFVEATRKMCEYWLVLNQAPPAHVRR